MPRSLRSVLPILLLGPALLLGQLTKQQKIERILDLTQSDTLVDEVVNQVSGMLQQIQPKPTAKQQERRKDAMEKISKIVRERVRKVRPEMIKAYSEIFSEEELDGLLAFYETPAGKASITKIPTVNARLSGVIQTELNAIGAEINKIAEDSLKQ